MSVNRSIVHGSVVNDSVARLPRLLSAVALSLTLLTGAGCAVTDLSFSDMGDSILQTVGLQDSPRSFNSAEGMAESVNGITPEQEYYIGRAVAARLLTIYKPVQDEALQRYVQEVGIAAAYNSELPDTFGGYHFLVVESDQVNSIAAPGGFVIITSGFLRILPDEEALAAVLSHEVTHVARHHGIQSISKDNLADAISSLGKIAGSLNCGEALIQATALFNQVVDDIVSHLLESGYSREQEFDADAGSVLILTATGYDQHGLLEALHALEKKQGKVSGGWFSTHPDTADRIEKIGTPPPAAQDQSSSGKAARKARFLKNLQALKGA